MNFLKRLAFRILFPNHVSARERAPVDGHDVFILDEDNTIPVHVARYNSEFDSYESDDCWFESYEVTLWSYTPNIENEVLREGKK